MSGIPEVQKAVRALEGVARAVVRWPEPHGPATLHLEFEAGADEEAVTAKVLEVLQEVGGVNLDTLSVAVPPPPPATEATAPTVPAPGAHGADANAAAARVDRPVFSGMTIDRTDLDNQVTVRLSFGGRQVRGTAEGLATRKATLRTAAAAALLALRELIPSDVRLQLEWLEVVEPLTVGRPELVHAAVTCLSADGEETFVGSAMARDDLREAAVRATLDALNRRLTRLVPAAS